MASCNNLTVSRWIVLTSSRESPQILECAVLWTRGRPSGHPSTKSWWGRCRRRATPRGRWRRWSPRWGFEEEYGSGIFGGRGGGRSFFWEQGWGALPCHILLESSGGEDERAQAHLGPAFQQRLLWQPRTRLQCLQCLHRPACGVSNT